MNSKLLVWVVGVGISAVGCSDPQSVGGEDVTTTSASLTITAGLPVPLGWNPMESAVTSFGSLRLNDRVRVRQFGPPTTALPAPVTNIGTIETNIGVDAVLGTLLSIAPVTLRERAFVNGSLYTTAPATMQNGVRVALFTENRLGIPIDQTWSRDITWPTNVQPGRMLEPGQSPAFVNLAPGAYQFAHAKTGRGFNLRTGEYFFDYMTIEPGAHLAIDALNGPVTVYLNQNFTLKENMGGPGTVPSPGIPIPSFTVVAFGAGANVIQRNFNGVMLAGGSIIVAAGVTVRGALMGRTVEVHQGAVIEHVRDSFAFQGWDFGVGIGRTQVTGGSIRRATEVTDEYLQSEAVTAITVTGPSTAVVVVGYNDKTEPTDTPKATYPAGRNVSEREVARGVSLMGWSFSTDGGRSFTYGGRVAPPPGWSVLWGDPAMAKVNTSDPNVYYANLGGSTAAFDAAEALENDANDTIHNSVPPIDGWCLARSTDRGINFSNPVCVPAFGDGGTIAAAMNAGRREVFLTGLIGPQRVWKFDGDATPMTVTELPPATLPPNAFCGSHPRVRASGGFLYLVCRASNGQIVGNRLDIATSTWQTPRVIAPASMLPGLPSIRIAPAVSFDVGTNFDDEPKVRTMFMVDEGGAAAMAIVTVECQPDLTGCQEITGWSTRGVAGFESAPSLRFIGFGKWMVGYWNEAGAGVGTNAGFLDTVTHTSGGLPILRTKVVEPPVFPCRQAGSYWGDYNEIDTYGESGIFMPYTVNGPGSLQANPNCRYGSNVMADHHVAGAAVGPSF
jgi:hypothetical protein